MCNCSIFHPGSRMNSGKHICDAVAFASHRERVVLLGHRSPRPETDAWLALSGKYPDLQSAEFRRRTPRFALSCGLTVSLQDNSTFAFKQCTITPLPVHSMSPKVSTLSSLQALNDICNRHTQLSNALGPIHQAGLDMWRWRETKFVQKFDG